MNAVNSRLQADQEQVSPTRVKWSGHPRNTIYRKAFLSAFLFVAFLATGPAIHAQTGEPNSQAAINAIDSDLEQEISAGSTLTGPAGVTVYTPTVNTNMLPCLVGSTGTAGLENLLKISTPAPFFAGPTFSAAGPTRASTASTSGTSKDGRTITPSFWNEGLFLPVTSGNDLTPALTTGTFTPPSWVLQAQDGSNPTTWSSALVTSSSNTNPVVSRYAYAIYHEGGMLDANVAGYPSTSTTAQVGYKPGLSYADLTQIGLTSPQVDTLVAWRNYASTQVPGPNFLTPDFTAASGSNYFQYVVSNTNGFLNIGPASFNNQTDQLFTSRQQLISFMENQLGLTGTGLNALNYLATFTRGINQPTVSPDPTRPLILNDYTNGGNTAMGQESSTQVSNPINPSFLSVRAQSNFTRNDGTTAIIGEPLVKRRFALSKIAWITYLGPSSNRVIPALGASNPGPNDPNYDMWQLVNLYGISPAYLTQGTPANIYSNFGLVWQQDPIPAFPPTAFHDGEYKWFYQGHNNASTSVLSYSPGLYGPITRLPDLAAASLVNAREPDFFELLKAATLAGSKAKGAFNLAAVQTYENSTLHPYYYQTVRDTQLDYAIIQLGANIIDQFKVDGYSTRIVFDNNPSSTISTAPSIQREFRGVENLPYLYRLNSATHKLRVENPIISTINNPHEQDATAANPFKDPGIVMIMQMPTIWNPHDQDAPLGAPGPVGPGLATPSALGLAGTASFQLVADSVDPNDLDSTGRDTQYSSFSGYGEEAANMFSYGSGDSKMTSLYTTGPRGTGAQLPGLIGSTSSDLHTLDPFGGITSPVPDSASEMSFSVPAAALFREPTILARPQVPAGTNLRMAAPAQDFISILNSTGQATWNSTLSGFTSETSNPLSLPNALSSTQSYLGICAALYPCEFEGPVVTSGTIGIYESIIAGFNTTSASGPSLTYRLQYRNPNTNAAAYSGTPTTDAQSWVTYDEKYTQFQCNFLGTPFGTSAGNLVNQADLARGGSWQSYLDPRTSRFAAVNGRDLLSSVQTPGGDKVAAEWIDPANDGMLTTRPDVNSGYALSNNRAPGNNPPEFWIMSAAGSDSNSAAPGGGGWVTSSVNNTYFHVGLLEQNTSAIQDNGIRFTGDLSQDSTGRNDGPEYYADPDGVVRGAMGNYVSEGAGTPASTAIGLPMATAYASANSGSGPYQGQSRPYILHRPFRSVADLGYVFSGTPWKNIDFFTPQSGDSPLLDLFTANESTTVSTNGNPLVAGVLNINTHQARALQAILSGAYVDEVSTSGIAYTSFNSISGQQAAAMLAGTSSLLARTTGTAIGRGPIVNVGDLVGRWNSSLNTQKYLSAGFSGIAGDLSNVYATALMLSNTTTLQTMTNVDRFREAFIRPLATVSDTRVWNLMIDLVSQTGQYTPNATSLDDFTVTGEQRYWLHEAIDRFTGQILDLSLETIGPASIVASASTITDNQSAGTTIATLSSSELLGSGSFSYALATGTNDNAMFTLNGNILESGTVFDALAKGTYNVVVTVTDQDGLTYQQPITITVQQGPYSQWKVANFGASASNPTVSGDLVDAKNDGLPNLLKYALGKSPGTSATSGITSQNDATKMTINYTRASAATDITMHAYWTNDVTNTGSWSQSGVTETMLSDDGTLQHWQATVPINGSAKMFMRVQVTRP